MSNVYSKPSRGTRQIRDRSTFLLIVFATFGLQFLTMVTGIIIARMLSVDGRGVIALVFALGLFSSQLTFGGSLPTALAKNLAERQIVARDGLRTIARRRAGLLVIPCVVVGGFMLVLQRSDPGSDKYLLAVAVTVMALQSIVFRILAGCLQGEGHLVRMACAGLMPQVLFTVVLTAAWFAGWGWSPLNVLEAFFVTSALGLTFAFASLVSPTGRQEDELDESRLWMESRRCYVSSVQPLDGLGLDRILVGALIGTVPLGLYAAATAVSNLCSLVGTAVTVVVLPRVAMHYADFTAQRAVIRRWTTVSALIIVVMVGALELVVAPIIRIAFGQEFAGAVDCARWLIVADGLMAFRKVLIAVMQGQGRGGTASWIELALLPLMLLGITVAALNHSLVGVGVTLTIVGLVACIAFVWAVAPGRTRPAERHLEGSSTNS